MELPANPADSDVPFFPFHIRATDSSGEYTISNHNCEKPIRLDRQAVEVLRLADGVRPVSEMVNYLVNCYPDAGGEDVIRQKVTDLLLSLTLKDLVWWRKERIQMGAVYPPQTIFWEITAACNLRCLHCVVDAGVKVKDELSTEHCLKLTEELAAFGVENIAFSGGEPLLHPDFFTLAEKVRDLGMTIQLATNGTLVTSQVARNLMDLDASVQVSLDGSTPEIHNYLRPGIKAFERSVEGIRALVSAGHQVTIGTVLSTLNKNDIPAMIAFAEHLGAASFRLIPFVPKGRGKCYTDLEVTPLQVKEVTRYLHDMRDHVGIDIGPIEFEDMLNQAICSDPSGQDRALHCGGAIEYVTILPSGEVLPCHFFEGVRADNIHTAQFRDIWIRSRFLNYFRSLKVSDLHGNCSTCSWLSSCGGSCRAVNYAKGDLFGGNKSCWVSS
jgi:radical SAM protein with 4Fe4S-binding SPASM domain